MEKDVVEAFSLIVLAQANIFSLNALVRLTDSLLRWWGLTIRQGNFSLPAELSSFWKVPINALGSCAAWTNAELVSGMLFDLFGSLRLAKIVMVIVTMAAQPTSPWEGIPVRLLLVGRILTNIFLTPFRMAIRWREYSRGKFMKLFMLHIYSILLLRCRLSQSQLQHGNFKGGLWDIYVSIR